MVSLLGNFSYEFPKPVELGTVMKDFLDDKVDEKYYLSERGGGTLPTQKDWTRSTRKSTILDVKYIGIEDEPRVYSNIIPTLSARDYKDPLRVAEPIGEDMRIRKLTPKEYWRLMGFTDEDFEKAQAVNSDTQLYKQAGNSIVVQVLEAIFAQMLP